MDFDDIPYFDEHGSVIDHKNIERTEQLLALKYIKPHHQVLELGSRYGTVSCVISTILLDPTKHVAVDPDRSVLEALNRNRENHSAKFNIVTGTISNTPMMILHEGYGTHTVISNMISNVKTYTLHEVEDMYNVKFDCLFADCEGHLERFFRDNPDIIKKLELVIFEADGPNRCNYDYIRELLSSNGFTLVESIENGFYNVWSK
jgi:hypothetical protein